MKIREEYLLDTTGRKRLFNFYKCDNCNKDYSKQQRLAEGAAQEHYCSTTCYNQADVSNKYEHLYCAHCNKAFRRLKSKMKSKSGLYFCCREHKDLGQTYIKEIQPSHYGTGLPDYRKIAFEHYELKCDDCSNKDIRVLQVHHKDRNRNNNSVDNLQILCANCHCIEHYLGG